MKFSAIATLLAAAAAAVYGWMSWCAFPFWSWNELRLAPAFALRHGVPLYPGLNEGPLSTWLYGPVGVLINLPATFASSAAGALGIAGAINLVVLGTPFAAIVVCAVPRTPRAWQLPLLAFALCVLLIPGNSLTYQVPDHAAIALGLLSCLVMAGDSRPTLRRLAAVVLLVALASWAKQIAVFLVPAHIFYLLWQRQRAAAVSYLVLSTVIGAVSFTLVGAIFGFSGVWLNLVEIPARLPWAEFNERVGTRLPQLLLLVIAPWPALALLRARVGWPEAGTHLGRLVHVLVIAAGAMLPVGLLAFFKIGGDINQLHSWYYLIPVFVLVLVLPDRTKVRPPWWQLGLVAAMVLCRAPEFSTLPLSPQNQHVREAELLARANPRSLWFSEHPLATFYSDARLYHVEDGIVTRHLAGLPLREAAFREYLPPGLLAVIYPAADPRPFALQLLPGYTQREVTGVWAVYTRPH